VLVRSNAVLVIVIESEKPMLKHEHTEFNPGQLLNPYWGLGV